MESWRVYRYVQWNSLCCRYSASFDSKTLSLHTPNKRIFKRKSLLTNAICVRVHFPHTFHSVHVPQFRVSRAICNRQQTSLSKINTLQKRKWKQASYIFIPRKWRYLRRRIIAMRLPFWTFVSKGKNLAAFGIVQVNCGFESDGYQIFAWPAENFSVKIILNASAA